MDTELLQALGAEVAEQMAAQRVEILRTVDERVAAAERGYAEHLGVLRERLADTTHRLELAQHELETLRSDAFDPVVAFSRDAGGAVQLLQRNGPPRALPLPDVDALVREAVEALGVTLRSALGAETHANVARAFELFCNAPAWTASAVYTAGDIVQTDVGRTYRVRAGVRATLGHVPGDDAQHWERLGTGGFRVLKSKPEALSPGDMFTEHDARFLHDGQTTILFVPKAAKLSDVERAVKGPHGLAQATQAELRELAGRVSGLLSDVQRNAKAANDAGEIGVQALAQLERVSAILEAVQRRLDERDVAAGGTP